MNLATIDYQLSFDTNYLSGLTVEVLRFWDLRLEKLAAKLQSLGPRPKDERSHLSEWAHLEREILRCQDHIWDAKIIGQTIAFSTTHTMNLSSQDLRWFFPALAPHNLA